LCLVRVWGCPEDFGCLVAEVEPGRVLVAVAVKRVADELALTPPNVTFCAVLNWKFSGGKEIRIK
jgi:hypothetical protein